MNAPEEKASKEDESDHVKNCLLAAMDVVHAQKRINLMVETDVDSDQMNGLLLLRKQRIHTLDLSLKRLAAWAVMEAERLKKVTRPA